MYKMLFVNLGNPITDRMTWSGTPFSLYSEFKKNYEVEDYIVSTKKNIIDYFFVAYRRIIKREKCDWLFTERFAKRASKELQNKIESKHYDVIFVIGHTCISYISTDVPIIYFSDAVFSRMVNYYWFGMKGSEISEYDEMQRKSLHNADRIIFSSNWAKKAAIDDYGIAEQKISVAHFGPNIDAEDLVHLKHIDHNGFNLLFIGADLKRKGIDTALKCVEICNKKDKLNHYVLHVVGGYPKTEINEHEVRLYGFLNRNIENEREQLESLRAISDAFILPTRAECSPIVLCESAAYGIPSLAYNTGGVSDYIIDGKTGYLLDTVCNADDFAEKIIYLANHNDKLASMKQNARNLYENDLNWAKLGRSIQNEIAELLE